MNIQELVRKNNTFWTEDRSLTALLAYVILNTFVLLPFSHFRAGEFSYSVVYSLMLLSGVFAMGARTHTKLLVLALALSSFGVHWLFRLRPSPEIRLADNGLGILFFLLLIFAVLRHIFRGGDVTLHRIQGAVAVYLLIGLVFSKVYDLIYQLDDQAFVMPTVQAENESFYSRFVYFSYVTLTTLGFGDIAPVNLFAKSMVIIEGLLGQLFPAIMITRLVTLEIEHRKNRNA